MSTTAAVAELVSIGSGTAGTGTTTGGTAGTAGATGVLSREMAMARENWPKKNSNFDENGWTRSKDWRKPRKISIELKTIEVGPLCLEVCFRSGQLLWPYLYVVPWSSMTLLRWHVKKLASKHIKTTLLICLLDSIPISTLQNPSCLIVTQNVDNYSQFQGNSKHRIG